VLLVHRDRQTKRMQYRMQTPHSSLMTQHTLPGVMSLAIELFYDFQRRPMELSLRHMLTQQHVHYDRADFDSEHVHLTLFNI
jgi:hypothetical protein